MIFTDLVGIIADDLTGANDTALQFFLRGAKKRRSMAIASVRQVNTSIGANLKLVSVK